MTRFFRLYGDEANLSCHSIEVGFTPFTPGRTWHPFNLQRDEYVSVRYPTNVRNAPTSGRKTCLYAGATVRYCLYNANLQGQFCDSTVEFDHDQLSPDIDEGWAGF